MAWWTGIKRVVLAAIALVALTSGGVLSVGTGTGVARTAASKHAGHKKKKKKKKSKPSPTSAAGIHKIKHVVIIMQENHSFDNYFGTYPGADGIPGLAGNPGRVPCIPDPKRGHCDPPYHEITVSGSGGPHFNSSAISDIDNGKMDGFAQTAEQTGAAGLDTDKAGCAVEVQLNCLDVTGYYNQQEIPNYWTYAKDFALQDHMFEPVLAWSEVSHLYMVSGWSAQCSSSDPFSCTTDITFPELPPSLSDALLQEATGAAVGIALPVNPVGEFSWTDITYLLHKYGVGWRYYIQAGTEPDCESGAMTCLPRPQAVTDPSIWNPLPDFDDVKQDNQIGNIATSSQLFSDAQKGDLPAVSWVVPSGDASEHAPANIEAGQQHVTNVINAIMKSPDWSSTAIFLSWDDWGGYYDHVDPPRVDGEGYGLRVPGLLISPYAKKGYIDHQTLSFDAYLKFIEDDFLGGARLDPSTDGRADPRPDVRENEKALGNLLSEFNFNQAPRKPVLLSPNPTGQVNLIGPGTVGTAGPNPLTVDAECPAASGSVSGHRLGPVALGVTRSKLRARLSKYAPKTNRRFDDFCLLGGDGIRVGYLAGKSVLAMTANPHYAYRNVRAGTQLSQALRRLGRGVSGPMRRGVTRWYAERLAKAVLLVKAQGNTVREIGLASAGRAASSVGRRRLLSTLRA